VSANGRVRIGARLRHAREASRQSLADVAARSGMSKGFISRIERDEASPSVTSLVGLCDAVGLPMGDLFAIPRTTLVRHAARPSLEGLPTSAAVLDTLITPPRERHVTVLESTIAPGGSAGGSLYTLPSECEVCFVLEGAVEVELDDERFRLGAGDALTFGAAVPHTWRNASPAAVARVLWILAPALPDPRKEAS
jgi:transcriptional regulator with XRE-family HTH domain